MSYYNNCPSKISPDNIISSTTSNANNSELGISHPVYLCYKVIYCVLYKTYRQRIVRIRYKKHSDLSIEAKNMAKHKALIATTNVKHFDLKVNALHHSL